MCLDPATGAILGGADGLEQDADRMCFSAGDRYLCVSHQEGKIAVFDTGQLVSRIVFASDRGGRSHQLYVAGVADRRVVRLTSGPAANRSPRWSPDGSTIAFVSNQTGPDRICLLDCMLLEVRILEQTDPAFAHPWEAMLDWSPDSNQIAFIGDDQRAIRIVDLRTGKVRTLIRGPVGRGWRPPYGVVLEPGGPVHLFRQPNRRQHLRRGHLPGERRDRPSATDHAPAGQTAVLLESCGLT